MKTKNALIIISCLWVCVIISGCKNNREPLKVAIAPYQDIAMIENIAPLKLDQKYNTPVTLLTMQWEDILQAV
ncbi:MAG: hypothetical protein JST32_19455, partial [Bacteroidetes bacterium]|nr:hypothetical protein [Bacteroidota bacterium]